MKKNITFAFLATLTACNQQVPEPPKITSNIENAANPHSLTQAPIPIPEANDANCKFEYMKSITDKHIQQTLADNCMRRNTLKPTIHKNWDF
jgi:entry exclusion lipoprotein TrbK